jgi:hypothetical protein
MILYVFNLEYLKWKFFFVVKKRKLNCEDSILGIAFWILSVHKKFNTHSEIMVFFLKRFVGTSFFFIIYLLFCFFIFSYNLAQFLVDIPFLKIECFHLDFHWILMIFCLDRWQIFSFFFSYVFFLFHFIELSDILKY